jgi:hypothetical protein
LILVSLWHYVQSFADLWVDFLLKETEEREKREASEAARQSQEDSQIATSTSSSSSTPQPSQHPSSNLPGPSTTTRPHLFGRPDSEFSTAPLASSSYSSAPSPLARPPPR